MKKRWDWVLTGLVVLVGIWGISGLWKVPGLPTSHDSISHLARLYAYQEGLRDGVFPVLWAKRLFWGIGSPVLMLNYQLPYYFALAWNYLGLSLTDSYKMVQTFSYLVSGILMYRALRLRFSPFTAFTGAVVYLVAPYRYLNIYVRGALGEVFASMFPPIILSGIWKQSLPLQTVGWAGLFLSHPVGSALFSAVLLGYQLCVNRIDRISNTLKEFFIPYLLAMMIGAFNLLPTLALTKYTYYRPEDSHTLENFPTFKQLLYSKWGYGFSTNDDRDEMSFQIGIIQWLVFGMTVIVIMKPRTEKREESDRELLYLAVVFIAAILLMIQKIATPIYVNLKMGRIIDFPWRILMLFSFITAIMAARITAETKNRTVKLLLCSFLISGSLYTNRNHVRINLIWPWPSENFRGETGDAYGEYASIWRNSRLGAEFAAPVELGQGTGQLKIITDNSNSTAAEVTLAQPAVVRFNIMYFPGWTASINGRFEPIDFIREIEDPDSGCFVTNRKMVNLDDSGLIACHVPAGKTQIALKYVALPVQRVANLITLAGIGILIWQMFRSFYQPTTNGKRLSR